MIIEKWEFPPRISSRSGNETHAEALVFQPIVRFACESDHKNFDVQLLLAPSNETNLNVVQSEH